jgi:hypothetical protein
MQAFRANKFRNLFICLPVLFVSMLKFVSECLSIDAYIYMRHNCGFVLNRIWFLLHVTSFSCRVNLFVKSTKLRLNDAFSEVSAGFVRC